MCGDAVDKTFHLDFINKEFDEVKRRVPKVAPEVKLDSE
jgi:hypothetical protein